ncbi:MULTISPECIES: S10 family peptidase [Bradyrhizobium]|jgi:carboxypeptidase C (cathepsin A)|uniref:Carboxypeptidase C (Cathepsin A) n=2 Tax=Bradyrhizobium TaxID=374 RepID=A0ABY0QCJ7_9BRAD|nr:MULTISPECIES: peptidase S10 [Bradyrhizobium]SDJ91348.1 Carboxypeptidase C (cathepsin A) [Bradyrhizobium ottawaense]SEB99774.1 Carboxypeptidase C (cathepsin A) [Bradyrhizobium lablabi]SHM67429.1 Carboxypeptidase C (cathepsin A) [Bradyrhizobium lablabi]
MGIGPALQHYARVVIALLVVSIATGAWADDETPPPSQQQPAATTPAPSAGQKGGGRRSGDTAPPSNAPSAEQHRLPPDSTTKQTLALPGRTLNFTATAGSIRLFDDKGEPQADIAYTSYQLDGADRTDRPVTFLFNGGPGASSAWLQFGDAGPWRLSISGDGAVSSASPDLLPNAETWLDFTDLVFIDPVGTGYSRFVASGDEVRKRLFSVDGDVSSIALVIRRWLEKYDRLLSPKFVAGESYGGIRGPKIVRNLQTQQGVGVRGLVLISPVLDFRDYSGSSLLQYVTSLPTMAAVAREAKDAGNGSVTRAGLADVEKYAQGEFLLDLIKGQVDKEATTRLADKVAALTGIDQAVSRRLAGRFEIGEFRREFDRRSGRVTGRYDASVSGFDPYPDSSFFHFGDPSGDPLMAPLTSAAVDLTTRKLNWRPDGSYQLLSDSVNQAWDFGRGRNPAESVSQLRQILALDPNMKLLVGHGLFDLATPYFASKIILDQLPAYAGPNRVKLVVYPGGHMFYSRDGARQAFRAEIQALMK